MSQSKAQVEARERLSAARAKLAAFDDKRTTALEAKAAAKAKAEAIAKRQPPVAIETSEGITLTRLITLTAYSPSKVAKENAAKLTLTGTDALKVGLSRNGQLYSARGLAQRTRLIDKAAVRAVEKAQAKMSAADAAAQRARQAWLDAKKAAHQGGTKIDFDEFVATVAKGLAVTADVHERSYMPGLETWNRDNLVRSVEQAELHVAATKTGAECPCSECKQDRMEAARKAAEDARRAALPTVLDTCPDGHRKRLAYERARDWMKEGLIDIFRVYCPVDGNHWRIAANSEAPIAAAIRVVEKRAARLAAAQESQEAIPA